MPRPFLVVAGLIALTPLLSSCKVTPLQVTPNPTRPIAEAPKELPRVPQPDPAAAEVPSGYRVEIAVKDLIYPTSVEFDDAGNMYVAEGGYVYGDEAAPCRIWRIDKSGQMRIIAEQLNPPITDLLWHQGRLYVSHRGKISALEGDRLRDLVTDLPSLGDHHNNQLAAGPDGKIYFGQGVATNAGVVGVDNFVFAWLQKHPAFHDTPARDIKVSNKEYVTLNPLVLTSTKEPPLVKTAAFQPFGQGKKDSTIAGATKSNGTILRMNADGSNLEVFAWGLRNPFGLTFGPDGNLYAADNGFDDRGSRRIANALDAIWVVKQNVWYGWPDFNAGIPVTDPRFKPEQGGQPDFIMQEHPPVPKPLLTRPHHVGVTKMDAGRNDAFGPTGMLYLTEVGDMNPITGAHPEHYGYDLVRIDPRSGRAEVFFRTKPSALGPSEGRLEYVQTPGPKRLVDVRFSPQGDALYVVDIGAIGVLPTITPVPSPYPGTGVIWRITRDGATSRDMPINLSPLPGRGRP